MYTLAKKPNKNKNRVAPGSVTQKRINTKQRFGFVDNRPEAIDRSTLQQDMSDSIGIHKISMINVSQKEVCQRLKMELNGAMPTMNEQIKDDQNVFTGDDQFINVKTEWKAFEDEDDEDDYTEGFELYMGQEHLNTAMSINYKENPSAINDGNATLIRIKEVDQYHKQKAVIAEGHHRIIWRFAHGLKVKYDAPVFNDSSDTKNLSDMKYGSV